jgi:hypothetical protein
MNAKEMKITAGTNMMMNLLNSLMILNRKCFRHKKHTYYSTRKWRLKQGPLKISHRDS